MKTLKKITLLLLSLLFVLTACDKRDFDVPPLSIPVYEGEANITIQELKDKYANQALAEITEDLIIQGVVTANDVSGNIYKQIQIQDETAGICIAIDRTSIYGNYRVGQEVFIELKGLFYGLYGGYPQIGYKYSRNNDGVYAIGQCPWLIFQDHIFLNGMPDPTGIEIPEYTIEELSAAQVGKVITLKNVYFEDGGSATFSNPTEEGSVQTLSKKMISTVNGGTLVARNSSAANFASFTMPEGVGSVTGVLSVYNATMQITFRDSLDCSSTRFNVGDGIGIKEIPWQIHYVLENQEEDLEGWIAGYIVGAVAPGINDENPIAKNEDILWEEPFLNNTVVLAATPDIKDWKQVVVVNLPTGSDIRAQVNLLDNPTNLGERLKVKGALSNQLGAAGLIVEKGASDEFVLDVAGEELEPKGAGTKEDPYNVIAARSKQGTGNQWVKGYIVGVWEGKDENGQDIYPNNYAKFSLPFYTDVNILIADSPNESDRANTICIQLSAGEMRNLLSPVNNTNAYRQELMVNGSLETYNSMPGIKGVLDYVYDGEGGEDPGPSDGDGTQSNPYTISDVISKQGSNGWATGYVVGIWEGKDAGGNDLYPNNFAKFEAPFYTAVNILIADSPTERTTSNLVCVQLAAGDQRTDLNPMNNAAILGQKIAVAGSFEKYNGFAGIKGVQDYTPKGSGGEDPGPTEGILNVSFTNGEMGGFSTYSVSGSQEWGLHSTTPAYGIVMSGYDGANNHANEDWLISPAMDLSGVTTAVLNFDHAINFASTMANDQTLWVSTNYQSGDPGSASWTQVAIATYPTGASWEFVASGNINLPASVIGQNNVKIAFKYLSTSSAAATWEIKNLVVSKSGTGGSTDPDPDPDPSVGGSSDNPYSVTQAITEQDKSVTGWVKGYIVGCVKAEVTSISSTSDVFIGVDTGWNSATNVMIADSPTETDYTKCVVVNLPSGKPLRTEVNLKDKPGNYQKELIVKGTLRKYFGQAGLRDSSGAASDFILK